MSNTAIWTISLPKSLEREALKKVRREHRTKSEWIREAIRKYLILENRDVYSPIKAKKLLEIVGILPKKEVDRIERNILEARNNFNLRSR